MKNTIMRDLLINENNIKIMQDEKKPYFNVKKLLNNDNLTQSQCVKFGDLFQKYVKSLIKIKGYELIYEDFLDVYDTKSETKKGKKDLDVCFTIGNTIYYFESKLNLNLDTEKTEATDNKIKDITEYLVKKNVNYNVVSALLTCWWGDEKDLPIRTKTKVYFMKDFLELINQVCDKNEYYEIMSDFGKLI